MGLSLALLRHVNSAYFALPRKIDSVREALTLLGTKAVRRWATVVALSSAAEAPDQVVALALLRARMCELLGASQDEDDRDGLFTVGLLSVADALLDAPMEAVLVSLPLSDEITGALLRHEGRRGRILGTVLRYEQGRFPTEGADPGELAETYLEALRWADEPGRWVAVSRMPLRFKLTLAFTGVMAVLLAVAGFALSLLVAQNLDSTIDDGLAARARDAAAVVDAQALASTGEPYAQVLEIDGRVKSTTTGAGRSAADHAGRGERARAGELIVERRRDGEDLRLLARPVAATGSRRSWSWASRSRSASGRSARCTRCCSSAGRWRC